MIQYQDGSQQSSGVIGSLRPVSGSRFLSQTQLAVHTQKILRNPDKLSKYFDHTDGYSTRDVIYSWTQSEKSPIQTAADMTLSQFDLIGYPHSNQNSSRPNGGEFKTIQLLMFPQPGCKITRSKLNIHFDD